MIVTPELEAERCVEWARERRDSAAEALRREIEQARKHGGAPTCLEFYWQGQLAAYRAIASYLTKR